MSASTARAVRIALCDAQALVLRGLSSLLADLGVEIALECSDAERRKDQRRRQPDSGK